MRPWGPTLASAAALAWMLATSRAGRAWKRGGRVLVCLKKVRSSLSSRCAAYTSATPGASPNSSSAIDATSYVSLLSLTTCSPGSIGIGTLEGHPMQGKCMLSKGTTATCNAYQWARVRPGCRCTAIVQGLLNQQGTAGGAPASEPNPLWLHLSCKAAVTGRFTGASLRHARAMPQHVRASGAPVPWPPREKGVCTVEQAAPPRRAP